MKKPPTKYFMYLFAMIRRTEKIRRCSFPPVQLDQNRGADCGGIQSDLYVCVCVCARARVCVCPACAHDVRKSIRLLLSDSIVAGQMGPGKCSVFTQARSGNKLLSVRVKIIIVVDLVLYRLSGPK